ncbi:hypothetical protein vseg_021227 [Gypsophila vaccaria]
MGRKKLDKVQNGSKKTRTKKNYTKTVKAVIKKADELSILCDVQICVIIYGPNGQPPIVWPNDPSRLNKILNRYLNIPLEERRKKAMTLDTLSKKLKNNVQLSDQVENKQVENLPKSDLRWDSRLDSFSGLQLVELANRLDYKLEMIQNKIDLMRNMSQYCYNGQGQGQGQSQSQNQPTMALSNYTHMQVMPSIQHQHHIQNHVNMHDNCYHQGYIEEQRRNAQMMVNNYGEFNNNNINVNNEVNNFGNHYYHNNEVPMWHAYPLTWCDPHHPQAQFQVQAQQFNDVPPLPFKYD